jgi:hypothetical protein
LQILLSSIQTGKWGYVNKNDLMSQKRNVELFCFRWFSWIWTTCSDVSFVVIHLYLQWWPEKDSRIL